MDHILFIHSSGDRHLGYFHVMAFVNTAAMNIGIHVSFCIMIFSGNLSGSGIRQHQVLTNHLNISCHTEGVD